MSGGNWGADFPAIVADARRGQVTAKLTVGGLDAYAHRTFNINPV